ncbi:hypothetical protein R1sor_016388 [Riccia sorocarpa]|uniref:Uncharacterized protein n=1 Tax=Riccia sorocarpa TaxID=122646 RepID=A0ABD3HL27_9MARC
MQRMVAASLRSCRVQHGIEGRLQSVRGSGRFASRSYASGVSETPPESLSAVNPANSRFLQRAGAIALCGAMGWAVASAAEDVYIYNQCSSKAVQKASQDARLKEAIGDEIKLGQWHWYQASLAVAHEGTSASCSFPVYGTEGVANIRLKAVRLQGKTDSLLENLIGGGLWEVLMLEAQISFSTGSLELFMRACEPGLGDHQALKSEAGPELQVGNTDFSLLGNCRLRGPDGSTISSLTPLQHAVLVADVRMVQLLAKDSSAYDPGISEAAPIHGAYAKNQLSTLRLNKGTPK